jgi:hypothetical protein
MFGDRPGNDQALPDCRDILAGVWGADIIAGKVSMGEIVGLNSQTGLTTRTK